MIFTGERPTLEHEIYSSRIRYKDIIPYCLNKKVLDFGCGIGQGTFFLSHFVKEITGYDCNPTAVSEAAATFNNIQFKNDFSNFDQYDIISMVEVLEHLEKNDFRDLLNKINKIDFVGTTPNGDFLIYRPQDIKDRIGYHTWHYTKKELEDLFKVYFRFVSITGHAYDPKLSHFTGYTIFASNKINWYDSWLTDIFMNKSLHQDR
jgi:SAM-dependent methyltransferase